MAKLAVLFISIIFGGCFFLSCSENPAVADVMQTYAGRYSQGIEDSPFQPCNLQEKWLLQWDTDSLTSVFITLVTAALNTGSNPMMARLKGEASERGQYKGIYEIFDRVFVVTEILEVRAMKAEDCQ